MTGNVKKLTLALNAAEKTNLAVNRAVGKSILTINKINMITGRTNMIINPVLKLKNLTNKNHGSAVFSKKN